MDFLESAKALNESNNSFIDTKEWKDDWEEYWVIFADLIAFANRCLISPGITLNNIVRFHKAVNNALEGIEGILKFQFTDACYILTKDSKTALIVASNIQNECLLQNYAQIKKMPHTMFYQMIVPKVVISKGDVLAIKDNQETKDINKFAGISSKELLAGAGIVNAYYLEKKTTGGLISVDPQFINEIKKSSSGDSKIKTNSLYKKWRNDITNKVLSHDKVVDIPWLALEPKQTKKGVLKTESVIAFKEKLLAFNQIWRMNFTEHLVEGTATDTLKQYGGGISHLCHLLQLYSDSGTRSWDLINLADVINKL